MADYRGVLDTEYDTRLRLPKRKWIIILAIVLVVILTAAIIVIVYVLEDENKGSGGGNNSGPFSSADVSKMRGYFEKNIDVSSNDCLCDKCHSGFVVAAPSQSNPDYYYHWQRDAGISMHVLLYTSSNWNTKFQNYVTWVTTVQTADDPNSEQNVLGEPKFNCDGTVYSGGWCRPQNDGPASRAIALIDYAFYLLDHSKDSYVNQYLYKYKNEFEEIVYDDFVAETVDCSKVNIPNDAKVDCGYSGITQTECVDKGCCWIPISNNPNNNPWCFYPNSRKPTPAPVPTYAPTSYNGTGTIVTDLNFVASVWQDTNNCDLWEEISGVMQFYTLMVQRFALLYGANLALKLGDTATASTWTSVANSMTDDINSFNENGIISEKQRIWDCSVILGSLYGGTPNTFMPNAATMFPPTDENILNTVNATVNYFKTAFPLNIELDNQGVPGTFLGRYKDDSYPGCDSNGGSQGHIWILCSNALAELYYRNSGYYYENMDRGSEILTPTMLQIISDIIEKDLFDGAMYLRKYMDILDDLKEDKLNEIMRNIAGMFLSQGNGQLTRVARFVSNPCNDHMSEQICEASTSNGGGMEIGAHDLTWSYGTVLSAVYYRDLAVAMGIEPWDIEISKRAIERDVMQVNNQDCSTMMCVGQCND